MRKGLYLILLGFYLVLQPVVGGDILDIPGHVEASNLQVMPKRGIEMDAVLEQFGEPDDRFGPIGEPPITEWVYGSFRVYFEYDMVLHTINLDTIIMPK